MKNIILYVLALASGILVGSVINMVIINNQGIIIPLPSGFDMNNFESSFNLLQPKHFIMPILAHAMGTLCGAILTALIAPEWKLRIALVIGLFFLFGGISMVAMFGGPIWFILLDLGIAYIPMAWLGYKIASKISGSQ